MFYNEFYVEFGMPLSRLAHLDSGTESDIGVVCAIPKGEDQVDRRWPPWRLLVLASWRRRFCRTVQPGLLLLASVPEAIEEKLPGSLPVGRGMGLQAPAGAAAARRIMLVQDCR
jgi:hypothetical protein